MILRVGVKWGLDSYCALRENRDYVTQQDFMEVIEKVRLEEENEGGEELFS